jgi:D-beta-D-heptose 7-phosphate kinase/D-beta-D-heptose 1-phosphate adenosyltransferase
MFGGAANVAACLTALGARTALAGVLGQDLAGARLLELCHAARVETRALHTVIARSTTRKTRVMAARRHPVRLDWEDTSPIACDDVSACLEGLSRGAAPKAVVLSDLRKGHACLRPGGRADQ